jgi:hypothetical protein
MSVHWGGRGAGHVSRWSPLILGVPTLDLNFAASPILDSRITFARSSAATVIDSSGVMQSAAVNAPRFDYDPVTLQPRGLLLEETRSNVLLNSLLSGVNLSTQSVTVSAVVYTLSFYGTGTITLTGAHSATVTGTGAFPARRVLTFTPGIGALLLTVSGTVQFAQLEVGAFATSFIPTTGILASRSGDVATITGANFSSWYNQNEGTFVVEGITSPRTTSAAVAEHAIELSGTLRMVRGGGSISLGWNIGSSTFSSFGVTAANLQFKSAAAYRAANNAASLGGSVPLTDAGSTYGTPTLLGIGCNVGGGQQFNGHIRAIRYFNRRLANTQLQTLST